MNVATIKYFDIANGPGVRVSLFVSGCRHHCKGCFNPETWDFAYGTPYTEKTTEQILTGLAPQHIRGLSLLGGEPFEPENQPAVLELAEAVRRRVPGKTIWCYSGYLFEELLSGKVGDGTVAGRLLSLLDVLVDGEFHEQEKNPDLRFCGSGNQRVIDVPASLAAGAVTLWDGRREP